MVEGDRPSHRAWLFLTVTGLPILAIVLAAVLCVQALNASQQHEVAEARSRLIHVRRTLETGANLKRLLAQSANDGADRPFVHGMDEGARQAALQSELKVFAEQAGVNIISLNGVDAGEGGSEKYTATKVEIGGSSEQVENFVKLLEENSNPVLSIKDISMRSTAAATLSEQTGLSISSEMTVLGVVQGGDAY